MLRIRPEQMEAFEEAGRVQDAVRLREYLRANHEGDLTGLEDDLLERRLVVALRHAKKHGLDNFFDVAEFARAMLRGGPVFDAHPLIAPILADRAAPSSKRMHTIWSLVTDAQWDEISGAVAWDDAG